MTSYCYLYLDDIMLETNAVTAEWTQNIIVINDTTTTINFKVDNEAQANIIPKNILHIFTPIRCRKPKSN